MQRLIEYFFDGTTPPMGSTAFMMACAAAGGFALLAGVSVWLRRQSYAEPALRSLYRRLAWVGGSAAAVGGLLIFFRQQHVFLLGARIMLYAWISIAMVRIGMHIVSYIRRAPELREKQARDLQRQKYLPR